MSPLVLFVLAGIVSYGFRISMIVGVRPAVATNAADRLRFVAPSALMAIVVASLFADDGDVVMASPAALLGVGVAVAAVRRSGAAWLALVCGFPAYWLATLGGF